MAANWDERVDRFWQTASSERPELALETMRALVAERDADDPAALYEWASVHDFLGREAEAIPLYRAALDHGLSGPRRPQAIIQLASSLRNVGKAGAAVDLLSGQSADEITGDAAQAFLALALHDAGDSTAALRTALLALAPTLPLYSRAVAEYANSLRTKDHKMNTPLSIREPRGVEEYPRLVEIWRSAVRATHDFLSESDFLEIESHLVPAYFPAVSLLLAERDGVVVGFAGVADHNLEMLFVDDTERGGGVGSALLRAAIERFDVQRVDVNEQNPAALGFYLSKGFTEIGRSEVDGDGKPYPILHLQLKK